VLPIMFTILKSPVGRSLGRNRRSLLRSGQDEVVRVCTEAVAVVRAVGADFFLDRWHVEIVSDNSIRKLVCKP
jgi:hypothetical protein